MAEVRGQAAEATPGPAIALVIFDCDGVLVDSEPLAVRVLCDTLAAHHGITVPLDAAYRDFLGRSLGAICATLQTDYGLDIAPDELAEMRHALYARYRQSLKPIPNVVSALERLQTRICVASSSQLERIRLSLELTGLYDRFAPDIFSAGMVEKGKPAPDLFLYAARQMGVAPGRCLVIEDSPAGIVAAKAAGMAVFAFTGGSHVGPAGLAPRVAELAPDAIFDDMQTLPDLLSSLENGKTIGPRA
ncbi:HAD family hydrolase [Pelagibacterium xiamenense]|uniref:HAD family hydrolase n=1 Tax=Pelagibacterium xiamenense TaxID=2901140 RepID=UPI001E3AF4BC|nr:HAD family hydrolase [Pelagibacterium xiamenense]MCD7058793.1 HAD family hydrolase [Pelagibacterium xiamenense]